MCFINKGNMYKVDDNLRKIPLDYRSLNKYFIEDVVLPLKRDINVKN